MKLIYGFIFIVVVLLSFQLSQRPLISDLKNYSDWFNYLRDAPIESTWNFHHDKGYLFLNIFFSKIPYFDFRLFLFLGVAFIYFSTLSLLRFFRGELSKIELFSLAVIVMTTVIPFYEVTHFYRQNLATAILLLVLTSSSKAMKLLGGFVCLTLHLAVYPFIAILTVYYFLENIYKKNFKESLLSLTSFIASSGYFLFIHFSKSLTLPPTKHFQKNLNTSEVSITDPLSMVFWVLVGIFIVYIAFVKNRKFILDHSSRVVILAVVLAWIALKFFFMNDYNISLRLNGYTGSFMFLLLLSTFFKTSKAEDWRALGMIVLASLSTVSFLFDL